MNPLLINGIFDMMTAFSYCITLVCGIFIGYWMGRNSADQPFRSDYNVAKRDQGPKEEPEQGDIFKDAMTEPEIDEKRIPTVLDRRL
ncbi:MAG: hypothetical protein ACYSW3_00330 [Planctomycetota bacterium]|jgi:hypothetical protein